MMVSWNVLDCLCPAVLSFHEMWWLKFSVRNRGCKHKAAAHCPQRPHLLTLPDQVVYSRDLLQCHL